MYKACWTNKVYAKTTKTSQNEIIHVSYNDNVTSAREEGSIYRRDQKGGKGGLLKTLWPEFSSFVYKD